MIAFSNSTLYMHLYKKIWVDQDKVIVLNINVHYKYSILKCSTFWHRMKLFAEKQNLQKIMKIQTEISIKYFLNQFPFTNMYTV